MNVNQVVEELYALANPEKIKLKKKKFGIFVPTSDTVKSL
jgi:hypothetical protein